MKFNNVSELTKAYKDIVKTKGGNIPDSERAFRTAYIELCEKEGVPFGRYAHLINVAGSTPYAWAKYKEPEPVNEDLDILDLAGLPKADVTAAELRKRAEEQLAIADAMELLTSNGYQVAKE